MGTKSLPGQWHRLAWHTGSWGWCARGPREGTTHFSPLFFNHLACFGGLIDTKLLAFDASVCSNRMHSDKLHHGHIFKLITMLALMCVMQNAIKCSTLFFLWHLTLVQSQEVYIMLSPSDHVPMYAHQIFMSETLNSDTLSVWNLSQSK